jgi:hypothetical protein
MKDDFTNGCDAPDDQRERHYDVFEEVAVVAQYLRHVSVLATIEERVRFARRRFGHYDLIDFVVVLLGYAISGERTLEAFYESVQPFAAPFMALFGRERLPHRSTLSRLLAALNQAPVEAALHRVSRRLGRSPAGEGEQNGRAVGPIRNAVARLRCGWHATSRSPTRLAIHS